MSLTVSRVQTGCSTCPKAVSQPGLQNLKPTLTNQRWHFTADSFLNNAGKRSMFDEGRQKLWDSRKEDGKENGVERGLDPAGSPVTCNKPCQQLTARAPVINNCVPAAGHLSLTHALREASRSGSGEQQPSCGAQAHPKHGARTPTPASRPTPPWTAQGGRGDRQQRRRGRSCLLGAVVRARPRGKLHFPVPEPSPHLKMRSPGRQAVCVFGASPLPVPPPSLPNSLPRSFLRREGSEVHQVACIARSNAAAL